MRREAVWKAIKHNQSGCLPYNVELTSEELEKFSEYIGIDKCDYFGWAGNYVQKAAYNEGGRFIRPGYFKDEFGVVWNRSGLDKDIGVVDEILIKQPDLAGYTFPEPDIGKIENITNNLVNNGEDTFKLGKLSMFYYEKAWSLRGMENLLMDFLLEPLFAERILDGLLQYNLKIIDAAINYDIDGFYFCDDYGQQNGMIMSPDTWRRFIKPGLAEMFARVKNAGKAVALHSCGKISDIFGDLIDIGLDVYQTVQPEVYDLKKLKTEYGKDLSFWGGISTQQLLPFSRPQELRPAVQDIVRIMSAGGGYIAAPTHQVTADVPLENVAVLVETLKDWNSANLT